MAEVVRLGGAEGVVVASVRASGGEVAFQTPSGEVKVCVYKARTPDVVLDGVEVHLVEQVIAGSTGDGGPAGSHTGKYAVMIDDPYWGRRVQPAAFTAAPLNETLVVGYRVKGQVRHNGEPIFKANVSLEGVTRDHHGVTSRFWDSQEFNELIWSQSLETWVEGPTVLAPIQTDEEGRWSFICPKGHGAIYQRATDLRDDSIETAAEPLERWVTKLWAAYQGRRVELTEEIEAVIDILSGSLEISGESGAWVKVGSLDEDGTAYQLPANGLVLVEGLPAGEHGVVQFRRNAWGEWDPEYGNARQLVVVNEGKTEEVAMGAMEAYDPATGVIAGRVYERVGVPAGGVAIVTLNYETGEFGETIATTDGNGYWEAEIPAEGLGGEPWIHDETWGSLPVLGFPYSDVVLGARAYSGWQEIYKPEIWRKGDRGHANFQYLEGGIWVEANESGERYDTEEAAYGGWVTEKTLPKFRNVPNPLDLLLTGPQLREYSLWTASGVLQSSFVLRSQSFAEYEELAGQFRATGYYPEAKFLFGGKIHGSVVEGIEAPINVKLPEALRLGLEFGKHRWYTQVRAECKESEAASCWTDLICPYCGGPTWRDPDVPGNTRGCCEQCAEVFGTGNAMEGRTHFVTPGIQASEERWTLAGLQVERGGGVLETGMHYHWRPDLYAETDDYLKQNGLGQSTNAPRWFAKHVNEVTDRKGFGKFNLTTTPMFNAGHDLEYFSNLSEVDRELGLAQVKLVFPSGYVQAEDVVVAVDCKRSDGAIETLEVLVPAGTRGPAEDDPVGQVICVKPVPKSLAEEMQSPYIGTGLYQAVTDVRVVQAPPGAECQFTLVNDVPLLASAEGILVLDKAATPVAWQMTYGGNGIHMFDDAVGQVFLFYSQAGNIWMTRRAGLPGAWETPHRVTLESNNRYPVAEKDETGRLILAWEHCGNLKMKQSRDDGEEWQ